MLKTTKKVNVITMAAKSDGNSTRKTNAQRAISMRYRRAKSVG